MDCGTLHGIVDGKIPPIEESGRADLLLQDSPPFSLA